jgi:RNA polymerase sigma-70 factor (ECF subfamily)
MARQSQSQAVAVEPVAPPKRSDRWTALLLKAQKGEITAFDALWEEARPAIWKRARQRLQNDTRADDVARETFAKAWRNLARYDPDKANASTWLYKIAERLIIDEMKKRQTQGAREVMGFDSLSGGEEGEPPVRLEPEDDVELAPPEEADFPLLAALVREGLRGLSLADQEVLRLCYEEQLNYEQIAARLGITQPAVGPRLTRARQRMLERLPPEALS